MPITPKQIAHLSVSELVTLKNSISDELETTITTEGALKRALRDCIEKEYTLQDDERVVLEQLLKLTSKDEHKEELRPIYERL